MSEPSLSSYVRRRVTYARTELSSVVCDESTHRARAREDGLPDCATHLQEESRDSGPDSDKTSQPRYLISRVESTVVVSMYEKRSLYPVSPVLVLIHMYTEYNSVGEPYASEPGIVNEYIEYV